MANTFLKLIVETIWTWGFIIRENLYCIINFLMSERIFKQI